MGNFLKIGNSQQNFETEKALGKATDFDLNAGEVVEVTLSSGKTASADHRIADPIGALLIDISLDTVCEIHWTSAANTVSVETDINVTGTLRFLVF